MSGEVVLIIAGLINGLVVGFLEMRKMRSRLDTQKTEHTTQIEKMKLEIQSESNKHDDAWRELVTKNDTQWAEHSRRQVEMLQGEINRNRRIVEQLTQDVTRAQELRAESETRVVEQETRIKEKNDRIDQLLGKLDTARRDMLDAAKEAATFAGQVTQLKQQTSDLQLALNKLQREVSTLIEQNRSLMSERDTLIIDNRRLLDDLSESQSHEAALLERINTLESRVNELVVENTALNKRIEELDRKWEERTQHEHEQNSDTAIDRLAAPGDDNPDDRTGSDYTDTAAA